MPAAVAIRRAGHALLTLLTATVTSFLWAAGPEVPKEFSIFVGQDVSVVRRGKQHLVVGAQKKAVEVMLDGKLTIIPLSEAKDLQLDRGVKLSNLRATIEHVSGTAGASQLQAAIETEATANAMAVQSAMEDRMDNVLGAARVAGMFTGNSEAWTQAMAQMPDLENGITRAARNGNDLITGKSGSGGGLHDTGYVVSFQATAPYALEQCHVVVIAEYTLPGDSGLTLTSVMLEPLGALGPSVRRFSCELRRFPSGAMMRGYRLALYSRGQEVATNLSSRRTDVTREEAILFMMMDYVAKHPGETRPPVPILMVPRTEFLARLGSLPLDQMIYARIGKDGKIIRFSTDEKGTKHLPSELSPATDQIAFVPALERGKPVEGVAKLKLADLVASN